MSDQRRKEIVDLIARTFATKYPLCYPGVPAHWHVQIENIPEVVDHLVTMIAAAERRGFEFAVKGGNELGRRMMPENAHPLVMYFADRESADAIKQFVLSQKPMTRVAVP